MIRALLKDSLIYGFGALFSQGISFFLLPIYSHTLSPEEYGALEIIITTGALANLTIGLQISQSVFRFYGEIESPKDKQTYASTAWWFTIFMFVLAIYFSFVKSKEINYFLLNNEKFIDSFRLGLISIFLNGLFVLIQNQLRIEFKSIKYTIVSLLYSTVTMLGGVILVYKFGWKLEGVLVGQITAGLLSLGLGWWWLRDSFTLKFDIKYLYEMLKFSIPLVPAGIAFFLNVFINRLALNSLATLTDVGLFGVGFRIAGVSMLAVIGIRSALTPLIYSNHQKKETPAQLAKLFGWYVVIAVLVSTTLGLFSGEILRAVSPSTYYAAAPLVVLLAPAILMNELFIFAPGIAIEKKTLWQLWIFMFIACLSGVLNWALITEFGVIGSAAATLLSSIVFLIIWFSISQRLYPIPFCWSRICIFSLFSFAVTLLGYTLGVGTTFIILIKFLIIISLFILSIFIGLIRTDDIKQGWKHALCFFSR